MSKMKRNLLIIAGLILLIGVCSVSLYFYAKKEINKPKFIIPDNKKAAAVDIPNSSSGILSYVEELYGKSFTDEVSVSKTVSLNIPDDSIKSELPEADNKIALMVKNQYLNYLDSLYKEYESVIGNKAENIRPLEFDVGDIDGDAVMTEGKTDDNGNISEDDYYFFDIPIKGLPYPVFDDASPRQYKSFAIEENRHVYDDLKKEVKDLGTVCSDHFEITSAGISGKIDKVRNKLLNLSISHTYRCCFSFQFDNEYISLGNVDFELSYTVTENYTFNWFGAYFSDNYFYINTGDEKALPLAVNVGEGKYKLKLKSSDDSKVSVDSEGVIEALEVTDKEKPVVIDMSFEYNGYTYSDKCFVTVTDLEISEAEG